MLQSIIAKKGLAHIHQRSFEVAAPHGVNRMDRKNIATQLVATSAPCSLYSLSKRSHIFLGPRAMTHSRHDDRNVAANIVNRPALLYGPFVPHHRNSIKTDNHGIRSEATEPFRMVTFKVVIVTIFDVEDLQTDRSAIGRHCGGKDTKGPSMRGGPVSVGRAVGTRRLGQDPILNIGIHQKTTNGAAQVKFGLSEYRNAESWGEMQFMKKWEGIGWENVACAESFHRPAGIASTETQSTPSCTTGSRQRRQSPGSKVRGRIVAAHIIQHESTSPPGMVRGEHHLENRWKESGGDWEGSRGVHEVDCLTVLAFATKSATSSDRASRQYRQGPAILPVPRVRRDEGEGRISTGRRIRANNSVHDSVCVYEGTGGRGRSQRCWRCCQ